MTISENFKSLWTINVFKSWQIALVLVACLVAWALAGIGNVPYKVVKGIPNILDYLIGMWPPDLRVLPDLIGPMVETVQMGVLGVMAASVIATPLSFFAARETSPYYLMYILSRMIINVCRAIPTLLWAILFVTMVGLGPVAGMLALTTHCVGALGKYFSEGVESIYPRVQDVMEAMEVDGATRIQAFVLGLAPAVSPLFLSYIVYYIEWSIRVGTILGLVGAGGLGFKLTMSIRMFRRHETCTIVLAIMLVVASIDALSRVVRKQLLESTV